MQQQLQTEETQTLPTMSTLASNAELAAEEATDTLTTQAIEEGLAELRRKARRHKRWFWLTFIGLYALFLFPFALSMVFLPKPGTVLMSVIWCLLLLACSLSCFWAYRMFFRRPSFDADTLAKRYGAQAAGLFLEYLRAKPARKERDALYTALLMLLRQMKASDANLLSDKHRQLLYSDLQRVSWSMFPSPQDIEYAVAILKALEQVGDDKAIPYVEQLANLKTGKPNMLKIKEAAIECLPALRANSGKVEANKTLLRASQPEASSPETLLRPASSGAETAPQQLLRAAASGEDTPSA